MESPKQYSNFPFCLNFFPSGQVPIQIREQYASLVVSSSIITLTVCLSQRTVYYYITYVIDVWIYLHYMILLQLWW